MFMSGVTSTYNRPEPETFSTHPKAVAGIVLIASLMLFSTVFGICMGVSWAISPPQAEILGTIRLDPSPSDYFGATRVAVSAVIGIAATVLFWRIADGESR